MRAFVGGDLVPDATMLLEFRHLLEARDAEMRQPKKGNAWHFGRKAHVGVDLGSGLVHTVVGTAANVADVAQAHRLLRGEEKVAFGDAGYQGVEKRAEIVARFAGVRWYVAAKRSKVKTMMAGKLKEATLAFEQAKAQVRAYVEPPFHVVKNLFRHRKTRNRDLAKNTVQWQVLFALANLFLAGRSLRAEVQA